LECIVKVSTFAPLREGGRPVHRICGKGIGEKKKIFFFVIPKNIPTFAVPSGTRGTETEDRRPIWSADINAKARSGGERSSLRYMIM